MSAVVRLTKIFNSSKIIEFDDSSKIVMMSDCHRGDGSWADDLARNENVYYAALNYYFNNGYTYIELGDGDELWENNRFSMIVEAHKDIFLLLQKFYMQKRLYMIYGNHDMVKEGIGFVQKNLRCYYDEHLKKEAPMFDNLSLYNAMILRNSQTGNNIFLIHGHQVDFLNCRLWKLARFLVRYLWKPLEALGVNDPTSPAKNNIRKSLVESILTKWVRKEKHMLIAGHTHRPVFPDVGEPLYFNDGSCVHPRCVTAIEITDGSIALMKWCIRTTEDGILCVKNEVMAGPEKLQDFFSANYL
jgi:UDP-2,3-diacylglucosamine pyrophosphatase LpxH